MTSAPFGLESGNANGDAILVEAVIDTHGRVEDYRVLNASGPTGLESGDEERTDLYPVPSRNQLRSANQRTGRDLVFQYQRRRLMSACGIRAALELPLAIQRPVRCDAP